MIKKIFFLIFITIKFRGNAQISKNIQEISTNVKKMELKIKTNAKLTFILKLPKNEIIEECGHRKRFIFGCNLNFIPVLECSLNFKKVDTLNILSILDNLKLIKSNFPLSIVTNNKDKVVGYCLFNSPNQKYSVSFNLENRNSIDYQWFQDITNFKPDFILLIKKSNFDFLLIKDNNVFILNDQGYNNRPTYALSSEKYIKFDEFYKNNRLKWLSRCPK
jgi:hypothetical protein